jgi:hypothetical protein
VNTNKIKIVVVGAGLAVVSAAGVSNAFASPATHAAPTAAVQSTIDTPTAGDTPDAPTAIDTPTAGDTPDVPTAIDTPTAGDTPDVPGGPDVQQGDQSAPDVAGASDEADSKTEAPGSENAGVSDGPGGYADQGNSNADTQQEGEH